MRHIRKLLLIAVAAAALPTLVPLASARPVANRNIVRTAVAAKQFKTLVALVKQAGLAETLEGKGPFTVFAPTDAAFAKVPARHSPRWGTIGGSSARCCSTTSHGGQAREAPLRDDAERRSLKIHVSRGTVTIGGARIIETNIAASNGVIHVINQVLTPR